MSSSNLLRGWEPLQVSKEVIKESRDANSGKILLKGILQRANALNQNGRIYPKNLLQREINNYQKFINESRALGECVPKGTKILAESGWKNIEDVVLGERVATLNTETNEIEYQETLGIVNKDYNGQLIQFKNDSTIDFSVTPDHKVLYWDTKGKAQYCSASEFSKFCGMHEIFHTALSYKGTVHCVKTQNGNWLMKQNEKEIWTGNCDHPNSSVVELKNVSHIVKEAHFEGDVVFGTIELLDTPSGKILQSLVESGVQLGISSRGVGSTRKEGDALVVQDDFCLICFDMVAEPSTPNAFLFTESVDRNILNKTFTASDRITRIANDIIMQGKKE